MSKTGESLGAGRGGRTPKGRSPANFEGIAVIYAGILWIALECVGRGFGECRIDSNYVPDVPIAAGSGHRGVTRQGGKRKTFRGS